jgi:dipeptidyl aminopeptidase/acylaminoacyl peptidase
MRAWALWWIFVTGTGWLDAQIVLSRRDYAQHGRTFSQIWIADSATLHFRRLTHSARDHSQPVCSRDGKQIYFISDHDPERSPNAYGGSQGHEIWVYDVKTGQERIEKHASDGVGLGLIGTTASSELLIEVGTELQSLASNSWTIHNVDQAAISPDGRRLALVVAESYDRGGQSQNVRLVLADAATGKSQKEMGKYEAPTWSPDGARIATFSDRGLAVLDATAGRELDHFALPKRDAPSQDIVWSPDSKSLLVGFYGENGGSGDPQSDYFLLNLATRVWTPALTARQLLWLRGETLLYLNPFVTTPLTSASRHSVWTSQLAIYDLASHKETALTSGLVLIDDFSKREQ